MPGTVIIQAGGTSGAAEVGGGRHVARGVNGVLWIVQVEIEGTQGSIVVYYVGPGAVSATREIAVAASANVYLGVSICIDTSDRPVISYSVASGSAVSIIRRESGVWTAKTGFATNGDSQCHQILCRENGNFDIAWTQYRSGTTTASVQHRVNTVDLGGAWAAATIVDSATSTIDDASKDRRVALAADHSGNLHLVYSLPTTSAWPLKYAKFTGTWGALETIETPPTNSVTFKPKHISLACDANAVPHVAWVRQTRTGLTGILGIQYTNRIGGTWATPTLPHSAVNASQQMPSLSVDQVGDVDIFWRGDQALGITYGRDVLFRAFGQPASLVVELAADLGATAIQPEIPHAWEPFGHGFFDRGYLLVASSPGSMPALVFSTPLSWTMEPEGINALALAQTPVPTFPSKLGANVLKLAQTAVGIRVRSKSVTNSIAFTQKVTSPRAANVLSLQQSAQTIGSIFKRSASNMLALQNNGTSLSPAACETTFVPTPAISADDSVIGKSFLVGPWPNLNLKVQMPLPDYGNERHVETRVKNLRARHGEVFQVALPVNDRMISPKWSTLSRLKSLEVDAFLDAMTGREIVFQDENGHRWRCIVLDSSARVTRHGIEFGGALDLTMRGSLLP